MNDPRADMVIAAVAARYPEARISVVPRMDPDSIQIPDLLIVLDADIERRREVERFALEQTRAAFTDGSMPWVVGACDPATAEEYLKGPPWLRSPATA